MRISQSLVLAATSFVLLSFATPVHAQLTRTWVSGVGSDVNLCSRTAPCRTFAGALPKTALGGEINCLDPGAYGFVTITKSITIDCHEVFAGILNNGSNGININFNSFAAADTRKTVRLRNLNLNGANAGLVGIRITGGSVITAGVVIIEDSLIEGNAAGAAAGISDERTAGGELYVMNTTIRNNLTVGITVLPGGPAAPVAGQVIATTIDNVRVLNSGIGIGIGNNGAAMISRATVSGNTTGISAVGTLAQAQAMVTNSVISGNSTNGILNSGGSVSIRLSNNDIAFNGTAISGATQSFTNNRLVGNGAAGTAPTAIGVTSNPTGHQ